MLTFWTNWVMAVGKRLFHMRLCSVLIIPFKPSFLDLHTYKNCFSWKKLTYLVGPLYRVIHESIQNLPEKHSLSSYFAYDKYAIVSLTKNLLWNVRHSSVQTFFFENYHQLSSNSVHFPSSSKKIFRFTFLLGFSVFRLYFVYETNETCDRIMVSNQFCQKKYLQQMLFFISCFLHWHIYLKDN